MAELDESRDESGLFCIRYFLLIFVNWNSNSRLDKKISQKLTSLCHFVVKSYDDSICALLCSVVSTALVALANEMLARLHVDMRVRSCVDMNSSLFITLYEGLCADTVKGKTFPNSFQT